MDPFNLIRKHCIKWWEKQSPVADYGRFPAPHIIKKQHTWALFTLLSLFIVIDSSEAAEPNILFVKSGSASVYDNIVDAAQYRINQICQSKDKKCTKPSISIESVQNSNKLRSLVRDIKWDLIITIGNNAAKQINSYHAQTPILYSLVPSHSYPAIISTSSSKQKSAIYIDQPIRRQLKLIKSAMPGKEKVGILLGSYSGIGKKQLQDIMRDMGLEPVIVNVTSNKIGSSLEDIYNKIDALLAQPDPSVYNKKTVMTVLLSSYRHNVPVFGYSAAFVRSGATAAIYSSPQDIGRQIGEEIDKFLSSRNRRLSPPAFPKYFSVDTNKRVIRSLNIRIPSIADITTGMMKAR